MHFVKVKMSTMTSFHGADLENARFANADLENCDFLDANLQGVDWYGTTFENCKFPRGFSIDSIDLSSWTKLITQINSEND